MLALQRTPKTGTKVDVLMLHCCFAKLSSKGGTLVGAASGRHWLLNIFIRNKWYCLKGKRVIEPPSRMLFCCFLFVCCFLSLFFWGVGCLFVFCCLCVCFVVCCFVLCFFSAVLKLQTVAFSILGLDSYPKVGGRDTLALCLRDLSGAARNLNTCPNMHYTITVIWPPRPMVVLEYFILSLQHRSACSILHVDPLV